MTDAFDERTLGPAVDRWRTATEILLADAGAPTEKLLDAVGAGVDLRRELDVAAPVDAAAREGLVEQLARLQQSTLQRIFSEGSATEVDRRRAAEHVATRLEVDDEFLARRLATDATADEQTIKLRVLGGLRDDLHWTACVLAAAERRAAPRFGLRAAVEERRLWELLERWLEDEHRELDSTSIADVHRESEQLRARLEGLRRELQAQMAEPPPGAEAPLVELRRRWRTASELLAECVDLITADGRIDAEEAELERAAQAHRAAAVDAWQAATVAAGAPEAAAEAVAAAGEQSQRAVDAAAFLEDSSYAGAVGGFCVLADDLAAVRATAEQIGGRFDPTDARAASVRKAARGARRDEAGIRGHLQDCRLQLKLEATLGRRGAAWFERMLLAAMLLFAAVMFASWRLDVAIRRDAVEANIAQGAAAESAGPSDESRASRLSQEHEIAAAVLAWCDLLVAAAFAFEFFFKLYLAEDRRRYVRRYWLTGLVPALPIGFAAWAIESLTVYGWDSIAFLRFLRYLRLPQMVRWLRLLRPVVQSLRIVGLAFRAGDRLVAEFAPLLNRNFVFFSRHDVVAERSDQELELIRLRDRYLDHLRRVAPSPGTLDAARALLARLWDSAAIRSGAGREEIGVVSTAVAREAPVEELLARLTTATSFDAAELIDARQARSLARWCRRFDLPLLRRIPLARSLAAAGKASDDYEATAAAARGLGAELECVAAAVHWAADLYGTLTAPQLVNSTGTWLVERTKRPTIRLLLFGLLVLAAGSLARVVPLDAVQATARFFQGLLGWPLIVLGVLCLIPLALGRWLRRIATQAGEFFDHVAEAQYFSGARRRKAELAAKHRADFLQRMLGPEQSVLGSGEPAARRGDLERTVEELWEDYLHGAPFHASDGKTTSQLLGNLALVDLRTQRLKYSRRDQARLAKLNLARPRGLLTGPYLWFHFISRSVSQQIARMLVDYHRNATPLAAGAESSEPNDWLNKNARIRGRAAESDAELMEVDAEDNAPHRCDNDFTAMHFLAASDELDAAVAEKYGEQTLALLRQDRRDNIRRVFRTYPAHRWAKGRRTWNPYVFYQRYFQGGRVAAAPLRLAARFVAALVAAIRWFARQVQDLLSSAHRDAAEVVAPDPFTVAERKILRMRRPVLWEAMRMRAAFDPPYVGVPFPRPRGEVRAAGDDRRAERTTVAPIEADLRLMRARAGEVAWAHDCGERMRNCFALLEGRREALGLASATAEGLRAAALALVVDHGAVRTVLEQVDRLERSLVEAAAAEETSPRRSSRGAAALRSAAERCGWTGRWPEQVFVVAAPKSSLVARGDGIVALPEAPLEIARRRLARAAATQESWTRQLVVLRAVQRLAAIDVAVYREFVFTLGEYAASDPGFAAPATRRQENAPESAARLH